ncbi:hypothetical protein A2Z33_04595 [Candidatus Gottesmanbacteria bacterium RBG_16_52_11]|uniref:Uncharacterized protein n=1 Tax=Candidatus Gottesmanbacteria bacterium RBG_16_52_11 TaxID=1798374 RepID=A0A1F5YUI5_9BACT|nr:MAG: hypothetical protein A2Z33_04595 [Candidatus Gottesmanbacteria bacterium RBG_16_52_11]
MLPFYTSVSSPIAGMTSFKSIDSDILSTGTFSAIGPSNSTPGGRYNAPTERSYRLAEATMRFSVYSAGRAWGFSRSK